MIKKNVTPKQVVSFLNSLLKVDHKAIEALFRIRVWCNEDMVEHKTVQALSFSKVRMVGFIGILNGLFGIDKDGWGCISITTTRKGDLKLFKLLEDRL